VSGATPVAKGLDHVIVDQSTISWVGGETGDLVYRGFDVRDLVPGLPYESAVHLILYGDPPSSDPSAEVTNALREHRVPRPAVEQVVDALGPALAPLDALRTILSALGDGSFGYPPSLEQGYRLIAQTPVLLARFVRRSQGLAPVAPRPELSHAANYLTMLTGSTPAPEKVAALDAYLVLLADHGMNASTFALRIAVSTQSDFASAATAALAVLKGPVHGGAPSRVSDMLDAVGAPDRADRWITQQVAQGEVLMGFGHRAYKTDDPRAVVLHRIARRVAEPARLELAEAVERSALAALRAAKPNARLYTNVEFWSAVVLEAVGLPRALFTPTFAVARTAGWTAHALEQASHNRLIRPDIEYVGPAKGRRWPRSLGGPLARPEGRGTA
jgi:citrate synthase